MTDNNPSMRQHIVGQEQKRDPKKLKFRAKRLIEEENSSRENAIDIPSNIPSPSSHKKHEK